MKDRPTPPTKPPTRIHFCVFFIVHHFSTPAKFTSPPTHEDTIAHLKALLSRHHQHQEQCPFRQSSLNDDARALAGSDIHRLAELIPSLTIFYYLFRWPPKQFLCVCLPLMMAGCRPFQFFRFPRRTSFVFAVASAGRDPCLSWLAAPYRPLYKVSGGVCSQGYKSIPNNSPSEIIHSNDKTILLGISLNHTRASTASFTALFGATLLFELSGGVTTALQ